MISLDEAFAGVDNKNIRDMFRLMTEFQFDFIINSQVLWGDCDTLDALAIYQLIRPGNAKFVTVMPYLWNGHRKELLEHEDEVEQRGIGDWKEGNLNELLNQLNQAKLSIEGFVETSENKKEELLSEMLKTIEDKENEIILV